MPYQLSRVRHCRHGSAKDSLEVLAVNPGMMVNLDASSITTYWFCTWPTEPIRTNSLRECVQVTFSHADL
jgi:hypothetical protein